MTAEPSPAILLLSSKSVLERNANILAHALRGGLPAFSIDLTRMRRLAERVKDQIALSYPDFQIPPHGCWRSFETEGIDRWGMIAGARGFASAEEMLLSAGDLAVLCAVADVALDPEWSFPEDITGLRFSGTEAKALAVVSMFASGVFSANPQDPLRADAHALIRVEKHEVATGFQLDPEEDAQAVESLVALFKRLGEAIGLRPDVFTHDDQTRPGCLLVQLAEKAASQSLTGSDVLDAVLEGCAPIWKGGAVVDDVILADTWQHSSLLHETCGNGGVPFHLPAIEIASSFVEPLAWAGVAVADLESLPGLSNLEHAAMFIESGVVSVNDKVNGQPLDTMIELRAVTLALLSELASLVRQDLDADAEALPLLCVQEGGTLPLGRKILMENRDLAAKVSNILGGGGVFWLPFKA